jgi:hypothetical protein
MLRIHALVPALRLLLCFSVVLFPIGHCFMTPHDMFVLILASPVLLDEIRLGFLAMYYADVV